MLVVRTSDFFSMVFLLLFELCGVISVELVFFMVPLLDFTVMSVCQVSNFCAVTSFKVDFGGSPGGSLGKILFVLRLIHGVFISEFRIVLNGEGTYLVDVIILLLAK
jgi:hypothetical protein